MLSAVLGYAQLLVADPTLAAETRGDIRKISEQATQVRFVLLAQLLFVFAREHLCYLPASLRELSAGFEG